MKPFMFPVVGICLYLGVECALGCSASKLRPLPPEKANACESAENRMIVLGCYRKDGNPRWMSKEGKHFKEACKTAYQDGRDWNAQCIATIVSCDEIDKFYNKGCSK